MRKLIGGLVFLIGCVNSPNYWTTYTPRNGTSSKTKPAAIQQAVIAITDAGQEIESSDATTGIVISKWFSGDGIASNETRFRLRVTIAEDLSFQVDALCQRRETLNESKWEACDDADGAKRPRFVIDDVAKIEAAMK